jgi:hypothetical protein
MSSPTRPVKLKTPPLQEAVVFSEARASYEAWERLADVSEDVQIHWIMPGEQGLG